MRTAAATTARARFGRARGSGFGRARRRGGEGGKLFRQPGRAAMRAFRSASIARAHQDFAVRLALPAMKLINRHGRKIIRAGKSSSLEARHETVGGFLLSGDCLTKPQAPSFKTPAIQVVSAFASLLHRIGSNGGGRRFGV